MQEFLTTLLICSVTMSALGLIYAALTPLLARRYSAHSRYYAWLIIVIGLIIPFRPNFGSAIVKYDLPNETILPTIGQGAAITAVIPSEITASTAVYTPNVSLWQIAFLIWLVGMMTFIAYHTVQHYRFVKMVTRWSEDVACRQALSVFDNVKSELGIVRQIGLFQCPGIGSPTLLGFAYPRILLPQADFTPDELRFILAHELTHLKRGDLLYKCAVLLAAAIHWFNPVVYLLVKAIDTACELSCDAETVRDADEDARQQYGETIIGVVRYQAKLKTALSTNFYGGKRGMKKRIYSIMDTSRKKTGMAILCLMLVLTLGTGMAFAAQSPTKSELSAVQDTESVTQIYEQSVTSYTDPVTGKTKYSTDGGKTWVDNAPYTPVVEWWDYDGYKVWMDEQIAALQAIADDGIPDYYDKNDVLRDFTQADVNEFKANCEEVLQRIKDGVKVSKSVDGMSGYMVSYDPQDMTATSETIASGTVSINSANGGTVEYDYSDYERFGLIYRDEKLYYNGEPVRCFDDWYSLGENMYAGRNYFDKDGTVDIFAQRDFSQIVHNPDGSYDSSGKLVGVKASSQAEFDARDIESLINPPSLQSATSAVNSTGYTPDASQGSGNATAENTAVTVQSTDGTMPIEVGRSFEQILKRMLTMALPLTRVAKTAGWVMCITMGSWSSVSLM